MKNKLCHLSFYLANIMLIFLLSCIIYLVSTENIGTPFNDSLTKKQQNIKIHSKKIRGGIYLSSMIFSIIIIYILTPFKL